MTTVRRDREVKMACEGTGKVMSVSGMSKTLMLTVIIAVLAFTAATQARAGGAVDKVPGLVGHLISSEKSQAANDDEIVEGFLARGLRIIGARVHLAYKVATNQMSAEGRLLGTDGGNAHTRGETSPKSRDICPAPKTAMTTTDLRRRLVTRKVFSF
ncbi:MAG: hypothetical protein AAFR20_00480 [Pseudomonadota bacterium]